MTSVPDFMMPAIYENIVTHYKEVDKELCRLEEWIVELREMIHKSKETPPPPPLVDLSDQRPYLHLQTQIQKAKNVRAGIYIGNAVNLAKMNIRTLSLYTDYQWSHCLACKLKTYCLKHWGRDLKEETEVKVEVLRLRLIKIEKDLRDLNVDDELTCL